VLCLRAELLLQKAGRLLQMTDTTDTIDINDSDFAKNRIKARNLDALSIASQWVALRSFFQGYGDTGYLSVRQYSRGGDTVMDNPFTVGYRPLNAHDHSNYPTKCGMAERQGMANGYLFKSRHTDYKLRRPAPGAFLSTERIDLPTLPADIVGTVDQQVTLMQGYFQAMLDKDHGTYDYRQHFSWALVVEEVWPEVFKETVTDTFESDRHTVDASRVQEQIWKHWRDEYGGIMDRVENINVWPIIPFITSAEGPPELGTIKNRVTSHNVGDFGSYHPDDILTTREDLYTERRSGQATPEIHNRYLRSRVKHAVGDNQNTIRYTPGILDELMYQCYGVQAEGVLAETYWDKTSNTDYNVKEVGGGPDLNAAKFSRFIGMAFPNASGRNDRRRGFKDANLFVSLTDSENVIGVSDGVRLHRYTWGIPMELVMLNPLMSWNPHNIQEKADPTEGGTLNGRTPETAYSGYKENGYYYLTPDEFYNGEDVVDPADTSTAKWVEDGEGIPRLCRSSGPWIVIPPIANVTGRVRGRYFIYEDSAKTPALAQALALKL